MYVGRFVVAGPSVAAYRVSSRSFPNRRIVEREAAGAGATDALTVVPTADATETDNPYVSYNCLRFGGDAAVVGNGSHVDPVAEKLELGYPARDALAECLLALDYEKDDYDTPRIAAVLDAEGGAVVGVVRRDALLVEAVDEPTLVATYERDAPTPYDLAADAATGAAREVYDADFEHAVCAAAVAQTADGGFETAVVNGE